MKTFVFGLLRRSEFWGVLSQAVIEAMHTPIPDEIKAAGWVVIALSVVSKMVKYIFPHPEGGAWMKNDGGINT